MCHYNRMWAFVKGEFSHYVNYFFLAYDICREVFSMPNCYSLPVLSAAVACAAARYLTPDETNVLSAFLCSVGDNLAIIAAREAAGEDS